MEPKPDPERIDEDNPEWTQADFDRAVPFSALPPAMQEKLAGVRSHAAHARADEFISVPLARDLVARFSDTGPGWQARINDALEEWLSTHSPADSP